MNCCSCVTCYVSQHQTWCLHSAASQRAAVITLWGFNKDLGKQQHVAFAVSFTTVQSRCWAGRRGGSTHVLTHTTQIRSNISCEVHLNTTSLIKKRYLEALNENFPKNLLYDFVHPSGKEPIPNTWKGKGSYENKCAGWWTVCHAQKCALHTRLTSVSLSRFSSPLHVNYMPINNLCEG